MAAQRVWPSDGSPSSLVASAAGQSVVPFGAFPGAADASVVVTGQTGILATSSLFAKVFPLATADHSVEEHIVEPMVVYAHSIVPDVGFTITAYTRGTTLVYGEYSVEWKWSN